MRVALSTIGDDRWMAGEVIVRNVLTGVRDLGLADTTFTLLSNSAAVDDQLRRRYPGADDYLQCPAPRRFSPRWVTGQVSQRVFGRDLLLDRFLREQGVDVVFGVCFLSRYVRAATLSWIPDFQHLHLPEMFSAEERAARDLMFRKTAELSTRTILLSHSVKRDFDLQLPQWSARARVLSPVSRISPTIYDSDPHRTVERYHLPEKFFYLPNQFWQHKNHELVFEAVKNLKRKGLDVTVVCTGFPGDQRNVGHFAALWEKVSLWDLRDRILYLGLIPHDDVLSLIRQAVCVLNPSRFEGWGISVDEARSVGKQILASAVPAHMEQDPPQTTYFDPNSVEDLEQKMYTLWKESGPGPDGPLEQAARAALPARLRSYAEAFVAVARDACSSFQSC